MRQAAHTHLRVRMAGVAFMDLACLMVGGLVGVWIRIGRYEWLEYVRDYPERWLLLFGSVILANYLAGSYRVQHAYSRFNLVVTWLFSLFFAVLILGLTSYAWLKMAPGRGVLALTLMVYSVLTMLLKLLVYQRLFRSETFVCRTVVLGTGERARTLRRMLENDTVLPLHRVVAFLTPTSGGAPQATNDGDTLLRVGTLDGVSVVVCPDGNVRRAALRLDAQLAIIGLDDPGAVKQCYPELKRLRFEGVEVLTPLKAAEIYTGRIPLDQIDEEFLMQASMESDLPAIRRVKRVFDIVVAGCALVLLAPLMACIAVAIRVLEPASSVFYVQERIGQFGRLFTMVKFRTMRQNAEAATGPVWAAPHDTRITRLGRILRRYRLDELPQLVNVLKGDMSLVGPRPEREAIFVEMERVVPFFAERLNVMPGLTGWAQIRYPYGDSTDDARRKLEYDLYYMKNLSISLDLQIILSTLRVALLGKERQL